MILHSHDYTPKHPWNINQASISKVIGKENNMSIEDEIFASALEAQGLHRTKAMYEPSSYPHKCSMCGEYPSGYKLKPQYVEDLGDETPYIYVCEDCLKDLEV